MYSMTERITLLTQQVLELYTDLEQHQKNFVMCSYGCRMCCDVSALNIEVTVLEFLPLAMYLVSENQLEWIDRAEKATDEDRCILFQPDSKLKPEGGCLFHKIRPLVCRLFGASFTIRKDQKQFLACQLLHEKVQVPLHLLPNAQDYHTRLLGIDFFLAQKAYGINTALRKAIQYVGLYYTPTYPTIQTRSA